MLQHLGQLTPQSPSRKTAVRFGYSVSIISRPTKNGLVISRIRRRICESFADQLLPLSGPLDVLPQGKPLSPSSELRRSYLFGQDYTWEKVETKKGPTARSGHRYVTEIRHSITLPESPHYNQNDFLEAIHRALRRLPRYRRQKCVLLDTFDRSWRLTTCLSASYLSDLWIFDTETYKWKEVEMRATDRAPGYVLLGLNFLAKDG
jgi:hypothetical protein